MRRIEAPGNRAECVGRCVPRCSVPPVCQSRLAVLGFPGRIIEPAGRGLSGTALGLNNAAVRAMIGANDKAGPRAQGNTPPATDSCRSPQLTTAPEHRSIAVAGETFYGARDTWQLQTGVRPRGRCVPGGGSQSDVGVQRRMPTGAFNRSGMGRLEHRQAPEGARGPRTVILRERASKEGEHHNAFGRELRTTRQ